MITALKVLSRVKETAGATLGGENETNHQVYENRSLSAQDMQPGMGADYCFEQVIPPDLSPLLSFGFLLVQGVRDNEGGFSPSLLKNALNLDLDIKEAGSAINHEKHLGLRKKR